MSTKYTFHQLNEIFELRSTQSNHTITVKTDHPKYSWMTQLDSDRLVSISDKGRWSSSKDYNNSYGTPGSSQTSTPINISLTKLDDLNIDDSLFVPMKTDTIMDKLISTEGGFLPGTNIMLTGQPGTGKTSIGMDLLAQLNANGKRTLFISAEMNRIDMSRYLKRFPQWGQVPMLFMADYTEGETLQVLETVIGQGWDMIFTDSFTEVCDQVKEDMNWSKGKVEKWFLGLMDQNNVANNESKTYTTFLTILQSSKGGNYVGSGKLKHMSSAMMHLEWDGAENSGRRFAYFSKNRMGQVDKKLYYELGEDGVNFDSGRYARDLFNDEVLVEERKQLDTEANAFDKLFGFSQDGIPEDLKTDVTKLESVPSL